MAKTALLVIGFVAAGAVGALTAGLVLRGDGEAPESGDPSPILARLDEIEDLIERNRREIEELNAPPPLSDMAVPAAAARAVVDAEAAAPALQKELQDKVLEAVEKNRAAEREEMGKRFSAMAAQRETSMIKRLEESAGLSAYQTEELTKLLGRRREAIGEFFRTMFGRRGGGEEVDFEAIQKKVADVRQETDEEIKALLTPEQYEKFTKEESTNRRGPWSMGGGRPRGSEER